MELRRAEDEKTAEGERRGTNPRMGGRQARSEAAVVIDDARREELRAMLAALGSRAGEDDALLELLLQRRRDSLDDLRRELLRLSALRLYWVSTEDHDEDWFVLAPDGDAACRYFEDFEGYDRDDAVEDFVADVPRAAIPALAREHSQLDASLGDAPDDPICALLGRARGWEATCHPSRAMIERCGGEFLIVSRSFDDDERENSSLRAAIRDALGEQEPRLVRFGERVFGEGDIVANSFASVRAAGLL